MSGHSKWNNIKHKKEKTDAQKAKVFTKIGKEIAVCVKAGGADPVSNSKLKDLIAKAKSLNVPNDNIDRIIKKASGADAVAYEEIYYEGYGPSGVAVIVKATTDSRNRTAGNLRHYFDKFGGNMGQSGCVSYLFSDAGVITIIKDEDVEIDADALMETALEAGAADFIEEEEYFEIRTETDDLYTVNEALEAAGFKVDSCEKTKIPSTYVTLEGDTDIKYMNLLLDHLDEDEDISDVYHNWENCD